MPASTLLLAPLVAVVAVHAALYLARERTRRRLPVCDEDREDALPLATLAAAFLVECAASVASTVLSAFTPLVPARRGDPEAAVRIVLVHGWAQRRGAVSLLGARLADRGFGVVCFSYPSLRLEIASAAESLRRLLVDLQAERQGPVHLVAFGVGGLVARTCVRRHRVPGVRRLVTIGTPHQGTLLAPAWAGSLGRLHPGSDLLRQLGAADHTPGQFEVTAIQSEFDATILPPENAYYPAAFNVIVRDTGHFSLLFSARVVTLIAENLEVA